MTHPTVFVVDDEVEIGRLVAIVLEADGYPVEVFHTAEAFQEATGASVEPHLLVVDKNLPGLSGLELVAMRRQEARRFEAIMVTGYADERSEVEADRLGICRLIRKPFVIDDLREAVFAAESRLERDVAR